MKVLVFSLLVFNMYGMTVAQSLDEQIIAKETEIAGYNQSAAILLSEIEEIKLERLRNDLRAIGLPSDKYIEHSAMFLEYSETHEQAKWVAHIITSDVIKGKVSRTNDFREDTLVETGTAVEADYFLKTLKEDGEYEYDGFGYDRGHLAPSADFRWSQKALSESYFYSNMSPQLADFNREGWAELEGLLRGYIYNHPETQLYVVTAPVLRAGLPVVTRGINKVSIPEKYVKIVLDLKNKRGIAFAMPNKKLSYPLETYALSIDEAERLIRQDVFPLLEDEVERRVEKEIDKDVWLPAIAKGDVEPLPAPTMPRNCFNTVQAKLYMGKGEKITVCGTVVSTRESRSGNIWLNLDKKYPNQIFSAYIKKEHIVNFPYSPEKELLDKKVCLKGEVADFSGKPTMRLDNDKVVEYFNEK